MVCTANDLQEWTNFPKGLRVLVLDEDRNSASEIRSMLEAMDYIVSTFCNETEALSAFSSKPESFHLAIVEVNTSNGNGTFKFLETAKELPIIMTSNIQCLSTMMKCIALGAVEFLRKPLSEDKLRNIWQHVVHKAFNAGGGVLSEPLKPVKESLASMLHVDMENGDPDKKISNERENSSEIQENDHEQSTGSDKYPAPSTPQLKQGARLLDDGDCQDHTNCSPEKESGEQDGELKSVETTLGDSVAEATLLVDQPEMPSKLIVKEEEESVDGTKNESNMSSKLKHGDSQRKVNGSAENPTKASGLNNSSVSKSNRKKMKKNTVENHNHDSNRALDPHIKRIVDWTPELHKKFVQAVEQLGVDQAIPSRILELMKVEGLTRHNVASHLQKYRMHKRHILPKEDDRRWPRPIDTVQRNYYPQQPIMAYPSYHSNHAVPVPPVYPMWGQPGSHPTGVQVWGPPAYPPWQPAESWHWNTYPGMNADAWGCPVMPPPHGLYASYPQNASGFHNVGVFDNGCNTPHNYFDLYPEEDVIDKVVKEAINKPWLPLPLGLKPPSTDSVLYELSRQGISNIPPNINGSNSICQGTGSNHG